MPQPVHTPTGNWPDLDGSAGFGPLQIQATGEVFSSPILIKNADPAMGLMCKLIDACDWLKKNVNAAIAAAIAAAVTTAATAITARINTIAGGVVGGTVIRLSQAAAVPTLGTWSVIGGSGDGLYASGTIGSATLMLPIDAEALPNGCTLTDISVQIAPDNSHASIAGLTLPQIYFFETTPAGISTQVGATGLDPSLTFTAYNLKHAITITGLAKVIDRRNSYAVRFNQESGGANAAANTKVLGVSVTRTAL
jgi:hypothetical protein